MTVNQLVTEQHKQGEETEFYPTDTPMVEAIAEWLSKHGEETNSILDIGCGNGSFFEKLDNTNFFKSYSYGEKNFNSKLYRYYTKVIGENLGFNIDFKIPDKYEEIDISDWSNFDILTTDGKLFCNVKLYKNGNRHIKFCKEFMQKLNVEMARINHWINSKEEEKNEFGYSDSEINQYWNNNLKIGITEGRSLLGLPQAV